MAFVSATWWDLLGQFAKANGQQFEAELVSVDGRTHSRRQGFRSVDRQAQEQRAAAARRAGRRGAGRAAFAAASSASRTSRTSRTRRKPYAPFTTSTLQQEANRKLGFTARRTMQVAQSLYENGHITYMRTDSTNLAPGGDRRRPRPGRPTNTATSTCPTSRASTSRRSRTPRKPTRRSAPPAIRSSCPSVLRSELDADEFRLFEMIWKRTIASQMADARGRRITITIEGEGCVFQVSGKTIDFPGYLRAYVEGSDDPEAELADQETDAAERRRSAKRSSAVDLTAKEHTTQPPGRLQRSGADQGARRARHRPAQHVRLDHRHDPGPQLRLQEGQRPGADLGGVLRRASCWKSIWPSLVDYQFTAQMEDDLDAISRGEQEYVEYLQTFYFGNGTPGLKPQLENKVDEIDARDISRILDRHARRRRAGVRARRPLFAVRRARRPHGVAARGDAAGRGDARSGAGAAGAGRSKARSRWASAPRRTSRCI